MYSTQVFAPNDPFKPSIHYGVKHITSRSPHADDLYTAPTLLQASRWYDAMRFGVAGTRNRGWGNERWGRSREDRAIIPGRSNWSPNGRSGQHNMQNAQETKADADPRQAPIRPAWRTVPERQPGHAAFESPVRSPSPPPERRSPSYARSPSRRSRSPYSRQRSESGQSSRSPRSRRTGSTPTGTQFELAVPHTSAPVATPAIAERISSSDSKISPPTRRSGSPGRTSRTPTNPSFSDLQTVPSEINTSGRPPSRGRPGSPPVFGPVDSHDNSKSRSLSRPSSHLPTSRGRAGSSLGIRFGMTPITSRPVIDAADAPPTHTIVGFKPEHASTPVKHVMDLDMSPIATQTYVKAFVLDTLPRQLYTYALLRLPHMYFSRVTRIFEEAELSMPQIKQGIVETFIQTRGLSSHTAWMMEPPTEVAAYSTLSTTWEGFIDSVLREWKTLNIISVLLLSAILTMLQLEGAGTDPLIRFTALLSMVCALMSLLYGCMFIIRFGTMRKTYKAAEWANEAQRSRTGIFWNVWVLLAMPATWLAWSMILYIICIMSFIWRTGTVSDATRGDFTARQALAGRTTISITLGLGVAYFFLILSTLKRYGDAMDRAWQQRISGWINDQALRVTLEDRFPKPAHDMNIPAYSRNSWGNWMPDRHHSSGSARDGKENFDPATAPTPHSWATWKPGPSVPPSPARDGEEKLGSANQVPSQHLEHKCERSISTNRHDYTSDWVAGQHKERFDPATAPTSHSWATWMPNPSFPPSPARDGEEKLGSANQVPSQHLEHQCERSISTNRHDYTSNWVAGQHDPRPEPAIPVCPSPQLTGSAIGIPTTTIQFHEHIPPVLNNNVTHNIDSAPETIGSRPLLRPVSPLQIAVNPENAPDTQAITSTSNKPEQLSGIDTTGTNSFAHFADAEASLNRSLNANAMVIANHGSNLVYMARVLRLQDTSVPINVFSRTPQVINGVGCDSWQAELERDIQLSWIPGNFLPMHQTLQRWNSSRLRSQNIQLALCKEVQTSGTKSLAIYSFSLFYPLQMIDRSAFVLPPYLRALEIFTQPLLKDDSVPAVIKIEWDCQAWVERRVTD